MQTPGRQVEPQTPMIAINRRVDMTLERLSKVEEDVVNIERPQRRIFTNVISQFTTINNSLQEMRDLINQDIRAKKKYYREETKILQKDSRNLTSLNAGFGRKVGAAALGLYGISQLGQGNFGEGAAGVGGAAALLSPEILGVITTVVTTKLASSGLLSRGGAGTIGTRVAGASRLRNPLLITAALAASLILPGLINSNQNADRRRQITASRTIAGRETINKPDVERFRTILARFDSILSSISLERKRRGRNTIDEEIREEAETEKPNKEEKKVNEDITEKLSEETNLENNEEEGGGFLEGLKNLFNFGRKNESEETDEVSQIDGGIISNIALNNEIVQGDANIDGAKITKNVDNTSTLISMDMIESGSDGGASGLLPNMDIEMFMGSDTVNNTGNNSQIIDLGGGDEGGGPSGFTGQTAKPTFVSVSTKFNKSIDKFESASALRSWGAFT